MASRTRRSGWVGGSGRAVPGGQGQWGVWTNSQALCLPGFGVSDRRCGWRVRGGPEISRIKIRFIYLTYQTEKGRVVVRDGPVQVVAVLPLRKLYDVHRMHFSATKMFVDQVGL
jgi:hypothetical protein